MGGGPLRILWQRFGPVHPYRGLLRTDVPGCLACRAHGRSPYPELTDDEMRPGLDLLPTWALEMKPAANRQVIAVMGGRLERGMPVVPMYGPLGLAFLQRQAKIAEQLTQARIRHPPTTP